MLTRALPLPRPPILRSYIATRCRPAHSLKRYKATKVASPSSSPLPSPPSSPSPSPSPPPSPNSQPEAQPEAEPEPAQPKPTLPFLPRPLGVPEIPTTARKSWKEETMELMDQDVRLARRRHIVKEATKGYYTDLNATRTNGGKTWIAPKTLIREDHSLYFPNISGTTLVSKDIAHTTDLCRGKISIIAMLSTAISEEHVSSFVSRTNTTYLSHPSYLFLQINLQENPAKALLVSLYASALRRKVPAALHASYLLSRQNMEYLREPLGMDNKHIGFVYVVDERLRVRWAGGGLALGSESEALERCVRVLIERLGRKGGSG